MLYESISIFHILVQAEIYISDVDNIVSVTDAQPARMYHRAAGDKWNTIAIETVGQKYIAQKQKQSGDGAMYSVVPIVRADATADSNRPVHYVEQNEGRFRVNVQVIAEKSATDRPRRDIRPRRRQVQRPAGVRKAVGAKKPSATLTASGRRILAFRQRRLNRNTRATDETGQRNNLSTVHNLIIVNLLKK